MLRGVGWPFLTDVSGQPIGPILKGQEIPITRLMAVISYRLFGTTSVPSSRCNRYVVPKSP